MFSDDYKFELVDGFKNKISKTFGELSPKDLNSILLVINRIELLYESDKLEGFTSGGYVANYFELMVETYIQNKTLYLFTEKHIENIDDYLTMYHNTYYENVSDALPKFIVGEIDGNDMFINDFIDTNFNYFNSLF